jgi:Ser/Thr protein kinase RdoA (MazF antagonist)
MSPAELDLVARTVLQHYPGFPRPRLLTPLGNRGGFSGARLWCLSCDLGEVCLRAGPAGVDVASLAFQHDHMGRARHAGLSFVPLLFKSSGGATWIEHGGRLWEAMSWQSGEADFQAHPSALRLRNACVALARLHEAWDKSTPSTGPCPALERRWTRASEWMALVGAGWRGPRASGPANPVASLADRAWRLLARHVSRVPRLLMEWREQAVRLQPCLCDVWHDHLLFEGDTLTGLVDYGGMKIDHVGVDLARMLGSLVGNDVEMWSLGLNAYRGVREFSAEEEALARAIDETGTIIGVVNWLLWIYRDGR